MIDLGNFFQQLLSSDPGAAQANLWVYLVLLVLVVVEGPFAILIASTAASTGYLQPLPVFIAASAGNLLADSLWYSLGYFGRVDTLLRWKILRIDPRNVNLLKGSIQKHVIKILMVSKLTNGLIVPALIATGVARVPIRRWFPTIFLTNFLVTGLFVVLGYFTAINLMKLEHWIRYVAIGFSIIFFVVAALYAQRLLSKRLSLEAYIDTTMGKEEE